MFTFMEVSKVKEEPLLQPLSYQSNNSNSQEEATPNEAWDTLQKETPVIDAKMSNREATYSPLEDTDNLEPVHHVIDSKVVEMVSSAQALNALPEVPSLHPEVVTSNNGVGFSANESRVLEENQSPFPFAQEAMDSSVHEPDTFVDSCYINRETPSSKTQVTEMMDMSNYEIATVVSNSLGEEQVSPSKTIEESNHNNLIQEQTSEQVLHTPGVVHTTFDEVSVSNQALTSLQEPQVLPSAKVHEEMDTSFNESSASVQKLTALPKGLLSNSKSPKAETTFNLKMLNSWAEVVKDEEKKILFGELVDPSDEYGPFILFPTNATELVETVLIFCLTKSGELHPDRIPLMCRIIQHSGKNLLLRSSILHILCASSHHVVDSLCKNVPVWKTLCLWLRECIDYQDLTPLLNGLLHVLNMVTVSIPLLRIDKDCPRLLKELSEEDYSLDIVQLAKQVVDKWMLIVQVTSCPVVVKVSHAKQCSFCGLYAENEDELAIHEISHAEMLYQVEVTAAKRGRFSCEICGKTYQQETRWAAHMETHKSSEVVSEKFPCSHCKLIFKSQDKLQSHVVRKHEAPKKIRACEECGKEFRSYDGYLDHMKWHRGELPFVCDWCNKGFVKKQSLIVHIRQHTDERPYTCEVCGASFRRCNHLQAHKNLHLDTKKFVCEECGAAFSQPQNLYYHKQLHSNEMRFVCKYCDLAFPLKVYLKNHMKRWHPGAPLPK